MNIYPPGSMIASRFEVVSPPKMGGMGIVYFCIDREEKDHPVALKTFRPELLPDISARNRFLSEGELWVELGSHPNIVQCYQIITTDIQLETFFILELISANPEYEDASLRSWIVPNHGMSNEQALKFSIQIVRGMKYATTKVPGFVHRDLKPENLLVGLDKLPNGDINRLRVTDFGLAKIKDQQKILLDAASTQTNQLVVKSHNTLGIVGTPLYMSPEQWKNGTIDVYTDIYAFGCILFELLTGKSAVRGKTVQDLMEAHCQGNLCGLPKDMNPLIAALLQKCLAVNSKDRYCDWDTLETALEITYQSVTGQFIPEDNPSIEQNQSNTFQNGASQISIGLSYMSIGKFDVAKSFFERALEINRHIDNGPLAMSAWGNLGVVFRNTGMPNDAIQCFEKGMEVAIKTNNKMEEANALGNIGNALLDLGELQQAIEYLDKAYIDYKKIGYLPGQSHSLGSLGIIYMKMGEAQKAISYYENWLSIALDIEDRRGENMALGNLGNAYAYLGDFSKSLYYYEQSLKIDREIGDRKGEEADLCNMGNAYSRLGDFLHAIKCLEDALSIARDVNAPTGERTALSGLAQTYLSMGQTEKAAEIFTQVLESSRKAGDLEGESLTLYNLAIASLKQGDDVSAHKYAKDAENAFTRLGHIEYARRASDLASELEHGTAKVTNNSVVDPVQAAFEKFQKAESRADMKAAIEEYPFMTDVRFIDAIRRIIKEQVPPEHRFAFEQRLYWLLE